MDEEKALQALKKRDEAALVWFVTRYAAYVNTILSGIAGKHLTIRDLEEMSSDVFMVLWRNAERIRPGKAKAYLSAAARNIARKSSKVIAPLSPSSRVRTATMPLSASLRPSTSMNGTFSA